MANYTEVARAASLAGLGNVVTDRQLQSGDRIRITCAVPWPTGYAFNLAGAEAPFLPLLPPSTKLIDVWGSETGDSFTVELEATSPPLAAVLSWIAVNWVGILVSTVIGLITLGGLVILCIVAVKIAQIAPATVGAAVWLLVAVGGWLLLTSKGGRSP